MKKTLIATLMLVAGTSQAQWMTMPIKNKTPADSFFAVADVKVRQDGYVEAWVMANDWFEKSSTISLILSNCQTKEYRVMQSTFYKGLGGTGGVIHVTGVIPYSVMPFERTAPGTLGDLYRDTVCNLAGK